MKIHFAFEIFSILLFLLLDLLLESFIWVSLFGRCAIETDVDVEVELI